MSKIRSFCLFIIFILSYNFSFCQNVDAKKLNDEISNLNDEFKYDQAFIRLEKIITDPKSTNFDKYNAYIQKAFTQKRLYNYPEILNNLELAYNYGKDSNAQTQRNLVEVKVLVEKMFVYFDTDRFDEVDIYLKQIQKKDVSILDLETKAFYNNVLAIWKMRSKDYEGAEAILNATIPFLKDESPKHLSAVYGKLLEIAQETKDRKKAEDAFAKGVYYARKYNMMIYEKYLHYKISRFYGEIEDYKQAYIYQIKANEMTTKYDANNYRGKLTVLDKNLLDKRKTKEIEFEKRVKILFILLFVVAFLLILVIYRLYLSNKKTKRIIESENARMRNELEKIAQNIKLEENKNIQNYRFTERQLDIINLVKQGKTNKEIGAELFISENTVKYHLKSIYATLGIENRLDLKHN